VTEPLECLDNLKGGCAGAVEYRSPTSPTGKSFPRCDAHWSAHLDWYAEHRRKYPDSDIPPAWFDPTAAGERWEDD
jgi:hypothetical protein